MNNYFFFFWSFVGNTLPQVCLLLTRYSSCKLPICISNHNFLLTSHIVSDSLSLQGKSSGLLHLCVRLIDPKLLLNVFTSLGRFAAHPCETQRFFRSLRIFLWFKCAINISYCYHYYAGLHFVLLKASHTCVWPLLPLVKFLFHYEKFLIFYS